MSAETRVAERIELATYYFLLAIREILLSRSEFVSLPDINAAINQSYVTVVPSGLVRSAFVGFALDLAASRGWVEEIDDPFAPKHFRSTPRLEDGPLEDKRFGEVFDKWNRMDAAQETWLRSALTHILEEYSFDDITEYLEDQRSEGEQQSRIDEKFFFAAR